MSLGQTCFARVLLSLLIFAGYTQLAVSQTVVNQPDSFDELARSTLAQIGGELSIPGLREPVEVLRDEWGIPHIYAQNTDDLFMAQGYIMAQDRLWQMEMWRRWHEGRLAEIFGPAAFDYDLRTRQMMFRGPWDESEWTSYHPEGERIFTAYANGVNAFIEQNRDNLPVEFQLTGVVPDPWTARTVVLRWAQVGLSSVRGHAISEILLARNVSQFGAEEANRRMAPDPWDDLQIPEGLNVDIITQQVLDAMRAGDGDPFSGNRLPALQIVEQYSHLTPAVRTAQVSNPQIATEGSNNWVMSGARSPTGIPILANDPHRRIEMPALRYFVHLNAPGWNVMGGGEPPFVGVDAGHNERMAWGFTFAGTDMVDVYVEEVNPQNANQVRWQNGWEPLRVIEEQIQIKGEAPRTVQLKFSRHGPVIFEDTQNSVAYSVRSVVQDPGTAAYKGSFKMAQAESCEDFFERAMFWMIPTHSLICGDVLGNIALQVTGLTPDRDGWNGRLPVPGNGQYEWQGFREDLPREFNPDRGYITTANNNVHPPGYDGRPVFYHSTRGVETARITRLHQILGTDQLFSVEDHQAIQHDAYILRSEGDIPAFQGWTAESQQVDRARALIAEWDGNLTKESTAAAIYVEWTRQSDAGARDAATPQDQRRALIQDGLAQTLAKLTEDWGDDWAEWTYGRGNPSALPHMFIPDFDLPTVERPGGFGSVNATGANFRRIIDLSNLDNSVATNAPGQSAQPGSPFYGDLADRLGNGEYFPFLFTREAIEEVVSHRLMLQPEN
ncbi:MAG: penicillin acylase family protein [Gammaproteobacteria bacterium]|jgi:penicillin amidase|nr:penicillin acylase family protein [Gammaproteobacteria bacterium]HJO10630.1 penicillin acylase family protein [Gammaproteobacteria bacterium]|tara:strand:+ start:443 stop:2785 length:2343 start_codon:yes stop_codon:yes gene_type:complete